MWDSPVRYQSSYYIELPNLAWPDDEEDFDELEKVSYELIKFEEDENE